jgi:hypothetical protein
MYENTFFKTFEEARDHATKEVSHLIDFFKEKIEEMKGELSKKEDRLRQEESHLENLFSVTVNNQ